MTLRPMASVAVQICALHAAKSIGSPAFGSRRPGCTVVVLLLVHEGA